MSLTTLYREGTDLDDLLAELDTRYPGQVRVVEVTHPREGGVLGFFAKQRVGVHYRLADSEATSPVTSEYADAREAGRDEDIAASYDEVPSARARTDVPERVAAEALGFGPGTFGAAIRARLQAGAGAPRYDTSEHRMLDGFATREPAAPPAALTARSADALGAAATRDDAPGATEVSPSLAAPEVGLQFAQILADIAMKKATAGAAPAMAPGVAAALSALRGEASAQRGAASGSRAADSPVSATGTPAAGIAAPAAEFSGRAAAAMHAPASGTSRQGTADSAPGFTAGFAAASFATVAGPDIHPSGTTVALTPEDTAELATAAGPVDAGAPSPADGPHGALAAGAPKRRRPRAVPHFPAPAAAADDAPATAATDAYAIGPDVAPLPAPPRPGPLCWPMASPHSAESAAGARRAPGATALLERPTESPAMTADQVAAEDSAVTPRHSVPSDALDAATAARHVTSLTLRRQLLELGVPVDRVPTDAVHAYAAVERLVRGVTPAPQLPSGPGQIVMLVGDAAEAIAAADALVADSPLTFDSIWTYGCSTASGTRRISTSESVIDSAAQAGDIATTARETAGGPTLIVMAAGAPETAGVIDAVRPDALWASVDATRKTTDTRRDLRALPRVDALTVTGAARSGSPATVWELDTPIAYVDGRPSSGPGWAVLLLGKLSELEESACSDALY